ncbi:Ribosomal RNA small subunit methyltransferase mra1 [Zancudomyces culisetae]|uniref:Ribosomal RNA small subunit methyltransferase mra1 n=1 Tax=Zancudomyces culisetae TaxID=1213189 RepID=A0A1R1PXN1_ZANCU|nr:Ribosomal RNA small subunit methyltransferase mra1 [Zancudomyces culisetae]OMH85745.1 Ribosomal RNA small subunit methyltransferase mra1 [Zancudomyces culisetae]|eukprot:OMH79628.1 Ribosomal RNA small subunit methyltransferase mra1 [Zancudomyces culisetae]
MHSAQTKSPNPVSIKRKSGSDAGEADVKKAKQNVQNSDDEKQVSENGSEIPAYKFVKKDNSTTVNMVPTAPHLPRSFEEKENMQRLIVILEAAPLEIYKVGKAKDSNYQLLNCDDHQGILRKMGVDLSHSRPDITHQSIEQSRKAASVYQNYEKCTNRSKPTGPYPSYV